MTNTVTLIPASTEVSTYTMQTKKGAVEKTYHGEVSIAMLGPKDREAVTASGALKAARAGPLFCIIVNLSYFL